ncbi:MAG: hypothetical protein JWN30_2244, partial [Bacilli bacterium]|nr:hypothetical protein [Bacilli bacterium]
VKNNCEFYTEMTGKTKELYLDNEHHDGYFRDQR